MPDVSAAPLAYSVADSAKALSVSRQSVRRLVSTGELRSLRIGSRVLIPRSELESFLAGDKK